MGDRFAYALAEDLDQSLLFKGDDFPHTGVTPHNPDDQAISCPIVITGVPRGSIVCCCDSPPF